MYPPGFYQWEILEDRSVFYVNSSAFAFEFGFELRPRLSHQPMLEDILRPKLILLHLNQLSLGFRQDVQCILHLLHLHLIKIYCLVCGRSFRTFISPKLGAWVIMLIIFVHLAESAFMCAIAYCVLQVWRQRNNLTCSDWFLSFPVEQRVHHIHLSIAVSSNSVQRYVSLFFHNQIINST